MTKHTDMKFKIEAVNLIQGTYHKYASHVKDWKEDPLEKNKGKGLLEL